MTQIEFFTARQIFVAYEDDVSHESGFVSVAQYPRAFEPEENEIGMVKRDGEMVRCFPLPEGWPWE